MSFVLITLTLTLLSSRKLILDKKVKITDGKPDFGDIPFVEDIVDAYSEYENYDYILVDTAGHSHHNEEQKNNTNVVIHALDGKAETEVYLVISATTKYKDLTSIADTYREMSDYKIIFTKLDETTSFGNLLNLKTTL